MHTIAEQLAAKEIDINPTDFVRRETIERSKGKLNRLSSGNRLEQSSNDLFYSFRESNSVGFSHDGQRHMAKSVPGMVGPFRNNNSAPSLQKHGGLKAQMVSAGVGDTEVLS